MPEYDLMEPFDIDHGELAGLRPQDVFVLGYELCQFHALADKGNAFTKPAHAANANRIRAALLRRGLSFGEKSENDEWVTFEVEAM
jgi:hypothetical protein